jgi:DNA-directed RNA polymerase specialized sigma24 family protein
MKASGGGTPSARAAERLFSTTHWSVVLAAGQQEAPQAAQALETLCRAYWHPLYVYVRRRGYAPEDAEDLTQEFFAHLLGSGGLGAAHPQRGKFRSFLVASLQHFLTNEWHRARTQKRGGGNVPISLDAAEAEHPGWQESVTTLTPERLFEQQWAFTVLEHALVHLGKEFAEAGKHGQFEQLRVFLTSKVDYGQSAAAAAAAGLSKAGLSLAVHRMRQRYRELVRAEIAHTVSNSAELDEEMRYLLEVVRGAN